MQNSVLRKVHAQKGWKWTAKKYDFRKVYTQKGCSRIYVKKIAIKKQVPPRCQQVPKTGAKRAYRWWYEINAGEMVAFVCIFVNKIATVNEVPPRCQQVPQVPPIILKVLKFLNF